MSNKSSLLLEHAIRETPLVSEHPDDPTKRRVTFLWCDADAPVRTGSAAVYLRINRVTDKDRVRDGLMKRIGDTDVWTLTLDLDADLRASYAFCPVPAGPDADDVIATLGSRGAQLPFFVDPMNPEPPLRTNGRDESSVVALAHATGQPEWAQSEKEGREWETHASDSERATAAGRVRVATSSTPLAGATRTLWTYLPATDPGRPTGVLVLFDADVWFPWIGLPAALDAAIATGRIPPFAVVAVEHADIQDRIATLSAATNLVRDIAEHVLPGLYAEHPEINWGGRAMTVVAGQSLGGMAALTAALDAPESYGAVLAHSPSMWWRPDRATRPANLADDIEPWLTERFRTEPVRDVRVRCDVGTLEGLTVGHARRLQEVLTSRGWDASFNLYAGGHDFAWWRGALIDGLASL